MRYIFPTARRTQRIAVTLVDGQDGQEYEGWVVRQGRYVFGLGDLYNKHKLPVGTHIIVRRHQDDDKIVVDFHAHRPRTEYVRLVTSKNNQIDFEDQKRGIGAEYDDLMIIGTDDLAEVDQARRSLQAHQPQQHSAHADQRTEQQFTAGDGSRENALQRVQRAAALPARSHFRRAQHQPRL